MLPPLVYIAGSAHGGSTLLDLLVSGHSAVFSLGEANNLHRDGPRCSCGVSSPPSCPFWGAVLARVERGAGLDFEALDPNAPDDDAFRRHNAALLEAVAAESGARVLLDSSKSPRRLRRLLAAGFDVRPLHLVRSPYGVAWSYAKRGGGVGKPARDYVREHRAIARALGGVPHLRVRYERLAESPEAELGRIAGWLDLDLEPGQLDFHAGERHNWGGNGLRFREDTAIRPDVAWREGLGAWQKLLVAVTTLPARSVTAS